MKWKFLRDSSKVDKSIFQRLDKSSDIWVKKQKLQELQASSKDMDEYARELMWRLLVSTVDIIALSHKKVPGVGFVKMFGEKNFESFVGEFNVKSFFIAITQGVSVNVCKWCHSCENGIEPNLFIILRPTCEAFTKENSDYSSEHVHKFAAQQKVAVGGKWTNIPTTEANFKAKFTAAFENRLKVVGKHTDHQTETETGVQWATVLASGIVQMRVVPLLSIYYVRFLQLHALFTPTVYS